MHRERPTRRKNPSGKIVWLARYTNAEGKRVSAGTYALKGPCDGGDSRSPSPTCCAQHAIDAAYGRRDDSAITLGVYVDGGYVVGGEVRKGWIDRYPRSERTDKSSRTRLNAVLDVVIEGRPLRDHELSTLRRKHANDLVAHMLTVQGRAAGGAQGILRTLSMLAENGIDDELTDLNFVRGVKVRKNDPRIQKSARKPRVFDFDRLREFAAAGRADVRAATPRPKKSSKGKTLYYPAVDFEPMLLTFALTGLRLGEVLGLERGDLDGDVLHVHNNAWEGVVTDGDTDEKHHVRDVPLPADLAAILNAIPPRIDTPWLFPTPGKGERQRGGGQVWRDSNFRRDVWEAAQLASGIDVRPHDCRHSYVTNLRAAGIDPADLAEIAAHDEQTATRVYTHAKGQSDAAVRAALA
jgi:integrase